MLERYQAATQESLYIGVQEGYKCTQSARLLKGINSPFTYCHLSPTTDLTPTLLDLETGVMLHPWAYLVGTCL